MAAPEEDRLAAVLSELAFTQSLLDQALARNQALEAEAQELQRLRAALTQMWRQDRYTGGFVRTKLSDLNALMSVFLASVLTIGLTALGGYAADVAGPLRLLSLAGSLVVSWGLFSWMIARLPRRPLPVKRCARAGLMAAVGFEVFKQVASVYLRLVMHGPAGTTFGPVLGLLVFAYITARLVLFATAWAATEPASGLPPADSATALP